MLGEQGEYHLNFSHISALPLCMSVKQKADGSDSSIIIPAGTKLGEKFDCCEDFWNALEVSLVPDGVLMKFFFGEGHSTIFDQNVCVGSCNLTLTDNQLSSFFPGEKVTAVNTLHCKISGIITLNGCFSVNINVWKKELIGGVMGERFLTMVPGVFEATGSLRGTAFKNMMEENEKERKRFAISDLALQLDAEVKRLELSVDSLPVKRYLAAKAQGDLVNLRDCLQLLRNKPDPSDQAETCAADGSGSDGEEQSDGSASDGEEAPCGSSCKRARVGL